MSLKCSCCGKPLSDSDLYILPDGTLNTMRRGCIEEGKVEDVTTEELSNLLERFLDNEVFNDLRNKEGL